MLHIWCPVPCPVCVLGGCLVLCHGSTVMLCHLSLLCVNFILTVDLCPYFQSPSTPCFTFSSVINPVLLVAVTVFRPECSSSFFSGIIYHSFL